eukprot:TRINITY_DN5566_c1_g2_i1.p1 TRINITY_DN5566_c1_g2~~TRINITY_DN5566_c1_g2_i1.p1  ORF type:complete len:285 (+),score=51.13 TRINITY_DN5566_c1_g2_i1:22-876(+)
MQPELIVALHVPVQPVNTIKNLISKGASPNTLSINKWSALYTACHYGTADHIRVLIELGADLNFVSKVGITPIHVVASKVGYFGCELVLEMLRLGADVNLGSGNVPLMLITHASTAGILCFEFIKELVEAGAIIDDSITLFHINDVPILKYLVDLGVDPFNNNREYTYLHSTASSPSFFPDVLEFFLKLGLDPNAEYQQVTPLMQLAQNRFVKDVNILIMGIELFKEYNADFGIVAKGHQLYGIVGDYTCFDIARATHKCEEMMKIIDCWETVESELVDGSSRI